MMEGRGICGYFMPRSGLLSGASQSESSLRLGEDWRVCASSNSVSGSSLLGLVPFGAFDRIDTWLTWHDTGLESLGLATGSLDTGWAEMGLGSSGGANSAWRLSLSVCAAGSADTSAGLPKQYWREEHGRPCMAPPPPQRNHRQTATNEQTQLTSVARSCRFDTRPQYGLSE